MILGLNIQLNNQTSVVVMEGQTHKSMAQNREPGNYSHRYSQLGFEKGAKVIQWKRGRLFTNGAGAIGHPQKKKKQTLI